MTNRNSKAHAALDSIEAGTFALDPAAVGYNFADGSSIKKNSVWGWMVSRCIKDCNCIEGRKAQATDGKLFEFNRP